MKIRPIESRDWNKVIELSRENEIPFPDFKNTLSFMVVEDEGTVIAFGYLLKFMESVFVSDHKRPHRDIVKSLKLLNKKSIEEARAFGIDQLNMFVTNNSFKGILIKHFNYNPSTGDALYLNIENG